MPLDPNNPIFDHVYDNTQTSFIQITEDKLENILIKFLTELNSSRGWLTPFSLSITILLVLLTASFNDFIGISKEKWSAIFFLGLLICASVSIWKIFLACLNRKRIKIEYLLKKIKNTQ